MVSRGGPLFLSAGATVTVLPAFSAQANLAAVQALVTVIVPTALLLRRSRLTAVKRIIRANWLLVILFAVMAANLGDLGPGFKWLSTFYGMFAWGILFICVATPATWVSSVNYLTIGMLLGSVAQTFGLLGATAGFDGDVADSTTTDGVLLTSPLGTQSIAAALVIALYINLLTRANRYWLQMSCVAFLAIILTGSRTYLLVATIVICLMLCRKAIEALYLTFATLLTAATTLLLFGDTVIQTMLASARGISVIAFLSNSAPPPGTWQFRQLIRDQTLANWTSSSLFDQTFGSGLAATNAALAQAGYGGDAYVINSGRIVHNTFAAFLLACGAVGLSTLFVFYLKALTTRAAGPTQVVLRPRQRLALSAVLVMPAFVENPLAGGATVAGVLTATLLLMVPGEMHSKHEDHSTQQKRYKIDGVTPDKSSRLT